MAKGSDDRRRKEGNGLRARCHECGHPLGPRRAYIKSNEKNNHAATNKKPACACKCHEVKKNDVSI